MLRCAHHANVQFSSVQFSSVQFSSVQFSSVQFSSVQFSSVQFSSVQFSSVQFSSVQFSSVQFSSVQFSSVFHSVVLSFFPSFLLSCLYISLSLHVAQGVQVLRSRSPASLFRAPFDEPHSQPADVKNHTTCVVGAVVPTLAV